MRSRGISEDTLSTLKHAGINLNNWLKGFTSVNESVLESVNIVKNHLGINQ